jgi:hypothetical protein
VYRSKKLLRCQLILHCVSLCCARDSATPITTPCDATWRCISWGSHGMNSSWLRRGELRCARGGVGHHHEEANIDVMQ